MNKTVIALLLLGMVAAAVAAELSQDKLQKMRSMKAKAMAKKRTGIDKMKDMKMREMEARKGAMYHNMHDGADTEAMREKMNKLREKIVSGGMTEDEYKQRAMALRGSRVRGKGEKRNDDIRNKRSIKSKKREEMREKKSAYKNKNRRQ